MKLNKRFFSLLLALALIVGMVPVNAMATDSAQSACEHCGVELTEGARHSVACPTYCTCDPKPAEGQAHSTLCPLNLLSKLSAVADYVEEQAAETTTEAPTTESTTAPATEPTTAPTTEPTTEPTTAPTTEPTTEPTTAPTTEPATEPATEPSTEATEPSTEATEPTAPEVTGPQVGDKIWIKSHSKTYIDPEKGDADGNCREVLFNYETEIVSIISDENGNAIWYEFKPSGLLQLFASYKYVAAADTSTEEPGNETEPDEYDCDCGENAPENLAQHADTCVRKTYVKTLFEGKTAEEIYANWDSYDEELKADILEMLESYDPTKLEELNGLIGADKVEQEFTAQMGSVSLNIFAPEGAFPEGTEVSVSEAYVAENIISGALESGETLLSYKTMDITFTYQGEEIQPEVPVVLDFTISSSEVPDSTNTMFVLHITDSGSAEHLGDCYLYPNDSSQTITVTAESFSSYVFGFSDKTYDAQKLSDALSGNSTYTIKTLPVNLFNYDTAAFNSNFSGNYLKFFEGGNQTFMPNDGEAAATQGIVKDTLVNGVPSMTYGTDNGAAIFDTAARNGKTVYANKNFQFIYNKTNGYYEYNSSLNHAQLNGNTVELYTDTLGPYNYYSGLTKGNLVAMNRCTRTASGVFRITGGDPHFGISGISYDVSKYGKLYLRMHSDRAETNGLQLFLGIGGYSEANSITLDLKSGWNEYYFDLSGFSGTITSLRIDPGNSVGNVVTVDSLGFIQTARLSSGFFQTDMAWAGFYPFESIENSYPNIAESFSISDWQADLNAFVSDVRAKRSFYNSGLTSYESVPTDKFHFGMTLETNFYIPESRRINNNQDEIIFEFAGDDDLWVFIDGKLVLDIGGAHTQISGHMNFTDGEVYVNKARTLKSDTTVSGTSARTTTMSEALRSPGYHTMKVFYLERASTASNCRLRFNLPVVPTGNVSVSKTVKEENNETDISAFTSDYTFKITVENTPWANRGYSVVSGATTVGTGTTDANGQFTLKHGQTAIFAGIAETKNVCVTEAKPSNLADAVYVSTTVNGKNTNTLTQTSSANNAISFAFTNTYTASFHGTLKLQKEIEGVAASDIPADLAFTYNIAGKTDTSYKKTITLNAANNWTAEISDVPVGDYTITEVKKDITNYKLTSVKVGSTELLSGNIISGYPVTVVKNETVTVSYTNTYAPDPGQITIVKKGVDEEKDPGAPFVFNIKGNGVNLDVVIYGNNSVTVKDLPAGTYEVTETTGYWRYDLDTTVHQIELPAGGSETVTFTNTRNEDHWLDDFAKATNIFKSDGSIDRE